MTKTNHKYKKLLNIFGFIVVAISLYFVADKIWNNKLWLAEWRPTTPLVLFALFCSVVYGLNSFFLSSAWQKLLVWFGEANATTRKCHIVYARSQIAKYIPGNVIHVAGRHVLGHKFGFGHAPLGGAAFFEVIGLIATSSLVALLGMFFTGEMQGSAYGFNMALVFAVALILPVIVSANMHKVPFLNKHGLQKKDVLEIVSGLTPTFLLHTAFFLVAGGILFGVASSVSTLINIDHFGIVITTFAFSWITGFITPGSPAGAGVREAIIIFSLTSIISEPESMLIALTFRMITVVGDILFFLVSFFFRLASPH